MHCNCGILVSGRLPFNASLRIFSANIRLRSLSTPLSSTPTSSSATVRSNSSAKAFFLTSRSSSKPFKYCSFACSLTYLLCNFCRFPSQAGSTRSGRADERLRLNWSCSFRLSVRDSRPGLGAGRARGRENSGYDFEAGCRLEAASLAARGETSVLELLASRGSASTSVEDLNEAFPLELARGLAESAGADLRAAMTLSTPLSGTSVTD